MQHAVKIENIEEMRRREGIDDVTLRQEIGRLRVGDHVKLTFLAGGEAAGETVPVRITSIKGTAFRGKLARDLTRPLQSGLQAGSLVTFTKDHVHSIAKAQPGRGAPAPTTPDGGGLPAAGRAALKRKSGKGTRVLGVRRREVSA
jgi:hypothetical protein